MCQTVNTEYMLYYAGERSQFIYKCDLTFFPSMFKLPFPITGLEYFVGKEMLFSFFFLRQKCCFLHQRNPCENRCKTQLFLQDFVLPAGDIPETGTVNRTVHLCSEPFTSGTAGDVSDWLVPPKLEHRRDQQHAA